MSSAEVIDILGYGRCRRCRRLCPTAILERSTNLCEHCIAEGALPHPSMVRVGSSVVKPRKTIKSRGQSKGQTETRRKTRRAHAAAAKRLRDCFPDLYRLLYITERSRQGLDPVPLFATPAIDRDLLLAAVEAAGPRLSDDGLYDALRSEMET